MTEQEFHEDDERTKDVFAAFEAGEKLRTQPSAPGQTIYRRWWSGLNHP